MGEIICTLIGFLFMFGSISIFISLIVEKHEEKPVKHSAIDNDLTDVIIADQIFNDDEIEIDEDLLEQEIDNG